VQWSEKAELLIVSNYMRKAVASTGTEQILVAESLSMVTTLYVLLNTGLSRLAPQTGTFTSVTGYNGSVQFLSFHFMQQNEGY
jgi:hypothetical protein